MWRTNVRKVLEFNEVEHFWLRVQAHGTSPFSWSSYNCQKMVLTYCCLLSFIPKHLQLFLALFIRSSCFMIKKLLIFIDQNYIATRSTWVPCSFFFYLLRESRMYQDRKFYNFFALSYNSRWLCVGPSFLHFMQYAPMKIRNHMKIAKKQEWKAFQSQ